MTSLVFASSSASGSPVVDGFVQLMPTILLIFVLVLVYFLYDAVKKNEQDLQQCAKSKLATKGTIKKNYYGNREEANLLFHNDSVEMAGKGYEPLSEIWTPDSYGFRHFLGAIILCFFIIGIVVFLYMLIVKPSSGTLTVVYKLKEESKVCSQCAESVKIAALVCRYCGHEFESS